MTKTYIEPATEIPVVGEYDVLVVGSGPGGLSAAIAAARCGASVGLVERFGCFGGNLTAVGVEGFAWYRHKGTIDSEGIGAEFESRARQYGAGVPEPQSISWAIDGEVFKHLADEMVLEAGITPLLHRQFSRPIMEGNKVIGIVTDSKAGREALLARCVVDATGDADVTHRAGAKTFQLSKQEMMSVSVMFAMSGVSKTDFLSGIQSDPQTYKDWETGEWSIETSGKEDKLFSPFLRKPFELAAKSEKNAIDISTIAGTWGAIYDTGDLTYLNLVHLPSCDGTDPNDLTWAEMEGRKLALQAIEALRKHQPGCSKGKLRNYGMTIGVRDTRKLDAVYNMTSEDVLNQSRFDDSIGIFPEFIDGYGHLILPTTGRYFQLPYRTLLPKHVDNIIAAGRITGGDKISHAATRNMMCCTVTGQAAGVAAALSASSLYSPRNVEYAYIRKELEKQGARLD